MKPPVFLLAMLLATPPLLADQPDSVAAHAINALGIDLLQQTARTNANALLSPYSIQLAMAMICAGADGETRAEMVKVLHYPKDEGQVDRSLAALQSDLAEIIRHQAAQDEYLKQDGVTNQPLTVTTANRLFGQSGYDFRPAYLSLLKDTYQSSFEPVDFIHNAVGATTRINAWVDQQTHGLFQIRF